MSLKNKEYIADGIASCYNFEIANAKDLEYVQGLLKQKYYKKEDVEKYCLDKAKAREVIEDIQKIQLESGSKDDYGHGMYNGMEMIKATLLKQEPKFLSKAELEL